MELPIDLMQELGKCNTTIDINTFSNVYFELSIALEHLYGSMRFEKEYIVH